MSFEKRLGHLRKSKGFSQKQMGEILGMSQAGYAKYESGEREPNLKSLVLISSTLNASLDHLLIGNEIREEDSAVTKNTRAVELTSEIGNSLYVFPNQVSCATENSEGLTEVVAGGYVFKVQESAKSVISLVENNM